MNRGRMARWRALPPSERRIVALAQLALPLIDLTLRLAGYMRVRRVLEILSPSFSPRPANADDLDRADRLAQLTAVVGEDGLVHGSCLRQALFVHLLLRRRGLQPDICFGVRNLTGNVEAHAWVELEGCEIGSGSMQHLPMGSR